MAEHDTRMAKIESELIHQRATTKRIEESTSNKFMTLSSMIENLTEQVATLVAFAQPAPTHSKRRPESSPSPNGAMKHPTKRISRIQPLQLDEDFADSNEFSDAIVEDFEESTSVEDMEDVEPGTTQSRSSSPNLVNSISMEGSEAGEMNTQPGSQES
jgi:hypothetical protein